MPFLDHLEELRRRLLVALGAIVVGVGVGFWLVQRFQLVTYLKVPIAPYLPDGRLAVLSPTDPFLIVLKLALTVGLVLASPVLLWQAWAFVAPGLYEREKRAILPSLFVGLGLFLMGAALGFTAVVPQALRVLFSFQSEALATMITYDAYFGFVLQIILALGLAFELPLVITILAVLGVATPARLARFRRPAVVLACVAGAFLSPGGDVVSMLFMTLPLILLYEVGYLVSRFVERRRQRAASALVLCVLMLGGAGAAEAQRPVVPTPAERDSLKALQDSVRAVRDSAGARRVGLPQGPTRSFAPADSVLERLLRRQGYLATRYHADSASFLAADRRLRLAGEALAERDSTVLEADRIGYLEATCGLVAEGDPRLFDAGNVLTGARLRYDTCTRRGVVDSALTSFQEAGTVWFLRGNVAQDSSSSRLYAGHSGITSCDLPSPHYHFAAGEVKWISEQILVARPAVLYVHDVPVMWLPFIFQDARPGRHSGILVPQFGINDIVRPSGGYERQVTNIGYYWAPNDYLDMTARFDWYANRYTQLGVRTAYRWLDRFLDGSVEWASQWESGGGRASRLRWSHRQQFDLRTTLNLNLDWASNTSIINDNAVDPRLNTQQITSQLNFSRRFTWGQVALGGSRRQSLTDESVTQQFPSLSISPKPLDLTRSITWSPSLSVIVDQVSNQPAGLLEVPGPTGLDTARLTTDRRTFTTRMETPLRIGSFNWRNSLSYVDQLTEGRLVETLRLPDESTPDPSDSITVEQVYASGFEGALDWQTGINLPLLFRRSLKLQPVVGVTNVTTGPFAIRNRRTGGDWVVQGKRVSLDFNLAPSIFGFWGGVGPVQRFRHTVQPLVSFRLAPAADIPEEYARAITPEGQPLRLRSDPARMLSVGLSQNIEAKRRAAPGDTTAPELLPKFRVLSINTSAVAYDFEQASQPGRTGWTTQTLSNTFQSDLLPGFSLGITHDLWAGPVGQDTTDFDPFLQNVSASFALSGNTIKRLLGAVGIGGGGDADADRDLPTYSDVPGRRRGETPIFNTEDDLLGRRRQFTSNFTYTLSRRRELPGAVVTAQDQQALRFSMAFSPTSFWSVSWSSQYNFTASQFESHVVRLERDLHKWRAAFDFVRNPNGNFAFLFSIALRDLPDVKIDYNQTSIVD